MNSNNQEQSSGKDSTNMQAGGDITQVGRDNITVVNQYPDIKSIEIMARGFISTMFPYTENAFNKLNLNTMTFLARLNTELEKLSPEELNRFSEVDVQITLRSAIYSAAKKSAPKIQAILTRLMLDRVQQAARPIVELVVDESINIISKLDENLIKILSLSFMFSRTKDGGISDLEALFEKLGYVANHFNDIEVSLSRFEYLEAISCGKLQLFLSNSLINIISSAYSNLFLNKITELELINLDIPDHIKKMVFIKKENNMFELDSVIALYIFQNQTIYHAVNGSKTTEVVVIDEANKKKITEFCAKYKMPLDEINSLLSSNINNFENIVKLWDSNGFSNFSLTAVGIAIGRTYLEQENFGNYKIDNWIK